MWLELIRNYFVNGFNFNGRISRRDYWLTKVVELSLILTLLIIQFLILDNHSVVSKLIFLFMLYLVVTNSSLSCRRLHDINMHGWLAKLNGICAMLWLFTIKIEALLIKILSIKFYSYLDSFLFIIIVLFLSSNLIITLLSLKKGDQTANDYGDTPKPIAITD